MQPYLETTPIYRSDRQVMTHSGFDGGNPRIDNRIADRTRIEARKVQSAYNKEGIPGQLIATAEDSSNSFFNAFINEILRNV
jgi:hypothetical protein